MKKTILLAVLFVCAVSQVLAYPVDSRKQVRHRRFSNALTRAVLTPQERNAALAKAVKDPNAIGQVRRLLNQGADPCRALPFAVFANQPAAVAVLFEYRDKCNWKNAVEERLQYVMQKDLVDVFYALMADNRNIVCPDPFDFSPVKQGVQWTPLSSQMLAAVNQRCFNTSAKQTAFLKDMILLNPGQKTVFALGENYKQGIKSSKTQKGWLDNINQLVNSNVKVSNDTLQTVISQSRVSNVNGTFNVPFEDTIKLTKLCMKGGANGNAVLKWFEHPNQQWVRDNYSAEEQMRLANVLERKPQMQSRGVADTFRKAYQKVTNWF